MQSGLQSREPRQALFAQRRQIAADATKSGDSGFRTERARDFLLNLGHAHIALRLVIIKRQDEVGEKGQHCFFARLQSIKQVEHRMAFARRLVRPNSRAGDWFASPLKTLCVGNAPLRMTAKIPLTVDCGQKTLLGNLFKQ